MSLLYTLVALYCLAGVALGLSLGVALSEWARSCVEADEPDSTTVPVADPAKFEGHTLTIPAADLKPAKLTSYMIKLGDQVIATAEVLGDYVLKSLEVAKFSEEAQARAKKILDEYKVPTLRLLPPTEPKPCDCFMCRPPQSQIGYQMHNLTHEIKGKTRNRKTPAALGIQLGPNGTPPARERQSRMKHPSRRQRRIKGRFASGKKR